MNDHLGTPQDAGDDIDVDEQSSSAAPAGWQAVPAVRIYVAKGALTVEAARLKSAHARREGLGDWTLQIDAAPAQSSARGAGGRLARREFDWGRKISIQLQPDELLDWVAVLVGWQPEMKLAFHGTESNKRLALRAQEQGLYFDIRHGEQGVAAPASAAHRSALALQAAKVLKLNHVGLDASEILSVLRASRRSVQAP